jgi:hypothetical protein
LKKKSQITLGPLFIILFMLSGCTGGCWKEITIRTRFDPSEIIGTIHNVTRTDFSDTPWFSAELDRFASNITNFSTFDISNENYSALRTVFINLGIVINTTSVVGSGSEPESSYTNLLQTFLRYETIILEIRVVNWCGS